MVGESGDTAPKVKRKFNSIGFGAPDLKKPKLNISLSPRSFPSLKDSATSRPRKSGRSNSSHAGTGLSVSQIKPWTFATKDCPECALCSHDLFAVCHPHISSLDDISRTPTTPSFHCQVCRTSHSKREAGGRRRVVLGSSTLHNLWKCEAYQPDFHIDFDCIIGGQIHDVHSSFLTQYSGVEENLDIVLACGVNNIPTSDTAEAIVFQFNSFVQSIKAHRRTNRIVISSLLYAPKYCNTNLPPGSNMLEKVRKVNKWIKEYNMDATGLQLDLSTCGVEGDPTVGNEIFHRWDDWREPSRGKKLHLAQDVKERVAGELISVFTSLDRLKIMN